MALGDFERTHDALGHPIVPVCDKCGRTFNRSNISATSPTCEECLIEALEQYPMAHGVRRRA